MHIADFQFSIADSKSLPDVVNRQLAIINLQRLLRFLVTRVLTAATAKLLKLETFRGGFLVLGSDVVAALAIRTLQYDVVTRHNSTLNFQISNSRSQLSDLKSEIRKTIQQLH